MKKKDSFYIAIIVLLMAILVNVIYSAHRTIVKLNKVNTALYEQLIAADKVINSINDDYFLDVLVETDEYQKYVELLDKRL